MGLVRAKNVFFRQDNGGVRVDEKPISRRTSVVDSDPRYEAWIDRGQEVLIRDKRSPKAAAVRVPWHQVIDYQLADDEVKEIAPAAAAATSAPVKKSA